MALKVQLKAPGKKNGAPCFGLSSCEKWIKWIVFRWCTFKNTLLLFGLITPNFRMMLHKTCSTLTQTHTRTTFSIWLWVNFYGPQRVFVYLQPLKIISSCVWGGNVLCIVSWQSSSLHVFSWSVLRMKAFAMRNDCSPKMNAFVPSVKTYAILIVKILCGRRLWRRYS